MIRRDYILRTVAELVQVLTRALSLRQRQEYELALREIDQALCGLRDAPADTPVELSLEAWIDLCRKHQQAASGLLVAVGDLLGEQGEILARQSKVEKSHRSRSMGMGLLLEAVLQGETVVTSDLLARIEHLVDATAQEPLPGGVSVRLLAYLVARGRFAGAEDLLFRWLETRDAAVVSAGLGFYAQLETTSDAELERGGLPRAEVEQGRREFMEATRVMAARAEAVKFPC